MEWGVQENMTYEHILSDGMERLGKYALGDIFVFFLGQGDQVFDPGDKTIIYFHSLQQSRQTPRYQFGKNLTATEAVECVNNDRTETSPRAE